MIAGAYYRAYSAMTSSVFSFIGLSPQSPQKQSSNTPIYSRETKHRRAKEFASPGFLALGLALSLSTLLLLWSEPKSPVRSPVSVPLTGAGDNTDPLPSVSRHSCCPASPDLFSF